MPNSIYFVDFSFSAERTLQLQTELNCTMTVMDHHKTAQKDLEPLIHDSKTSNISITFDMNRAGCQIVWDFCCQDSDIFPPPVKTSVFDITAITGLQSSTVQQQHQVRRPWIIDYVADRDLWNWSLASSREINAGLQDLGVFHTDCHQEDNLQNTPLYCAWYGYPGFSFGEIYHAGMKMLVFNRGVCERLFSFTQRVAPLSNFPAVWVECPLGDLRSELGEYALSRRPEASVAAIWSYRPEQNVVSISLRARSSDDTDVSQIAEQYGGGGHRNAAGFRVNVARFESLITPNDS
jgi:hypothetical protein